MSPKTGRASAARANRPWPANAPTTPEGALKRLDAAGVDRAAVRDLLSQALISPVLTAHPSEVRRKSVIDRIGAVGALLDGCDRDGIACSPATLKAALRRQIVILWATRLTRASGLVVQDEINTRHRLAATHLPARRPGSAGRMANPCWTRPTLPPFLRIGTWVGGDRDGNPNVDAEVLAAGLRRSLRSSRAVLRFYLEEANCSGRRTQPVRRPDHRDARTGGSGRQLRRLLDPARGRALSRRALKPDLRPPVGSTHLALTGGPAPLPAQFEAPAYDGPDAFRADLAVLHDSLIRTHGAVFADDRLTRLITAADIFGFHMATLDLRQNSDVHERVVADLLKVAGVCPDYAAPRRKRRG